VAVVPRFVRCASLLTLTFVSVIPTHFQVTGIAATDQSTGMSDVHKGDPAARGRGNGAVSRFLGGPPMSVLLRLVLLSILVGVILSAVGLDPLHIWQSLETLIRRIWDMGFDAVRWAWRYFLLGAALVVPIWLFVRLTRGLGRL
jgi:hypothetical protein